MAAWLFAPIVVLVLLVQGAWVCCQCFSPLLVFFRVDGRIARASRGLLVTLASSCCCMPAVARFVLLHAGFSWMGERGRYEFWYSAALFSSGVCRLAMRSPYQFLHVSPGNLYSIALFVIRFWTLVMCFPYQLLSVLPSLRAAMLTMLSCFGTLVIHILFRAHAIFKVTCLIV